MNYYFSKTIEGDFENTIQKVTDALQTEGFGIITEIDLKGTFKKKLDVDFYNYKILGACNPTFAYKALQVEDKVGIMLPCNVIIQEKKPGEIEIAAVDPVVSMESIKNPKLKDLAEEIGLKLKRVIENI